MSFFSQFGEDRILSQRFPEDYKGVCVEVGAYDGHSGSNTLHFKQLGWECICIEPNPTAYEACRSIRKRVVNCCVGATNSDQIPFTIFKIGSSDDSNESAISSLEPDARLIESHIHLIKATTTILVQVRTLTSILDEAEFPRDIDFISIDTENTEIDVLN